MSKKITWDGVYDSFKSTYPQLRKEVSHWHPHSYAAICVYFTDGKKGVYDYMARRLQFISE